MHILHRLPNKAGYPDQAITLIAAAVTSILVFAMQIADSSSGRSELFMLVLPIALLAVGFGLRGGIVGAVLAIAVFVAWSVATDASLGFFKLVPRPVTFLTVGVAVGLASDSMKRTQAMMRAIADGTDDAIYVKDPAGRYIMANDGAVGMIGVDHSQVLGHTDSELMPPDTARSIRLDDAEVLRKGSFLSREEVLSFPDGTERILLTKKGPMRDGGGRVVGLFGVSRDVTEQRRLERAEIEAAQRVRGEYERARRDYSIMVRHRLMNPLTVIRGSAQTLRDISTDRATHEQLCDQIVEAARQIEHASLAPETTRAEESSIDPVPHIDDEPPSP